MSETPPPPAAVNPDPERNIYKIGSMRIVLRHHVAAVLFFLFAYIVPLGFRPMVAPDEFRYAEIPREMILRGDWVSPRLLNFHYFEKPGLGYQMTVLAFKVFGENAFALRLPAALAAGLTALLAALYLRRQTGDDRMAALAAVLYLASGIVYGVGTFGVLDSQTTLFVFGAMAAFLPACLEEKWNRPRLFFLVVTGVFAGLGFLTKGFLAFVVPGLTAAAFLIWQKRWRDLFTLPWIPLVAAVAVAAPWSLLIHQREPDFWRYFVMEEHFNRFFAKDPDGQHGEPFWFFIPVLLLGGFPAALLAPCAIRGLWIRRTELLAKPYIRYALCMLVLPFLFFSCSSGKLATYVLPCFAPLAILGAVGLACYFRQGGEYPLFRRIMVALGLLLMLVALAAPAVRSFLPDDFLWRPDWLPLVFASVAVFGWGALLALTFRRSWRDQLAIFFAGMAPLVIFGQWAMPESAFGDKSPERALRQLRRQLPPGAIVVSHRGIAHAVAWSWEKPDLLLAVSEGEFDYGLTYPESKQRCLSVADYQGLLRRADRPPVVYVSREKSMTYLAPDQREPEPIVIADVAIRIFPPATREGGK